MRLLSMSGFVPEHVCDIVRFTQYAGDHKISHFCGYASDFISQVLQDNTVEGAIFPRSCDSSRIIGSYLQDSDKFIHQMDIPGNNGTGAEEFFGMEIKRYKENVEKHFDVIIDEEQIAHRTELINGRNNALKEIYSSIDKLSYSDYLESIHEMLEKPLTEQQPGRFTLANSQGNKKVYIIGSFLSNIEIVRKMEELGLNIVGDSLPESGRLSSMPAAILQDNIYLGMSKSILNQRLSPTQNNFRAVLDHELSEIERKEAKGVVFITQQYCEPYDYYYSIARKAFEERNLQVTQLAVNGTTDDQKAMLSLEAFADTL